MTSKYKRLAISMRGIDSGKHDFKTYEMIERAALDEAVALLKDAKNHWGDYAPQSGNARKTFDKIDTFLKGLGEE